MAELAYARHSKCRDRKVMWVRLPLQAHYFMPKAKLPDIDFKWTPQLAYAIGLLTTDGNLSKDGRHIIMRSSDTQLLRTFKKCLSLTSPIKETFCNGWAKKPAYRVQFSNVQLYRWLLKIGLFPAKTYTIGELDIPDYYFRDFLRGHLDGDGDITIYTDYYNTYKNPKYIYTRLYTRFRSANGKHVKWLREKIFRLSCLKGHLLEEEPKRIYQTTSMWILRFAKKESIELLSWLYYHPNVPCLIRKRKIAEKFI